MRLPLRVRARLVMDRGEVVAAGPASEVDEGVVKRYLTV
jgi:hypothetical protein